MYRFADEASCDSVSKSSDSGQPKSFERGQWNQREKAKSQEGFLGIDLAIVVERELLKPAFLGATDLSVLTVPCQPL